MPRPFQAWTDVASRWIARKKAAWAAYELYKSTITRFRRLELTEEQLAKIKTACQAASAELTESGDDKKATRAVTAKLRWAIDVLVLTPEQRQSLGGKSAGKGKGKS